jgi:hypothetical protein
MTPVSRATIDVVDRLEGGAEEAYLVWTHGIDIDTEDDWQLADALMGRP